MSDESTPKAMSSSDSTSPKRRPRWRRTGLVGVLVAVIGAGSLGASMYFFDTPIEWPWTSSSMGERVDALSQQLEALTAEQANSADRTEQTLNDAVSRLDALTEAVDAQSQAMAALQSQVRSNAEALEARAPVDERAQRARRQNQRAIDALSERLTQAIDQWEAGALPQSTREAAVEAHFREQGVVLEVLSALIQAERAMAQYDVESALQQYDLALERLAGQTRPSAQALADQLIQERATVAAWPLIDWRAHRDGVVELGETLRQSERAKGVQEPPVSNSGDAEPIRGSLWRRLQQAAQRLVTVRPRDPAKLSEPETRLMRVMLQQRVLLLESALVGRDVKSIRRLASHVLGNLRTLGLDSSPTISDRALTTLQTLETLRWPDDQDPPSEAIAMARAMLDRS